MSSRNLNIYLPNPIVNINQAGAATGFQGRDFLGTKLFQGLGTNLKKKDQNLRKKVQNSRKKIQNSRKKGTKLKKKGTKLKKKGTKLKIKE